MPKLIDLSPELQRDARRILAMPQDTEAARAASVREWHRFLNTYGVENVSMFADDFGSMFLRDQHGVVAPALEHMT